MLNKEILAGIITLLWATSVNAGNRHHVIIDGGIVHMRGAVTASACAVSSDSISQTVDMGQFRSNQFHGSGSYAPPVEFNIFLSGCSTAVSKEVGIAFRGITDGKDLQVLKAGEGENAATGLGLAILDSQGEIIAPNTASHTLVPLINGDMSLRFIARYRATSHQVTGGDADAWTWFALSYQ
ncbi:TPA: fimbrial protein [Serratia fonticola]|uniref:fimbrial protein n=1 Tax=Serratia fonticola TaxID=47917 RepID=UPI00217C1B81|nr:fimbrial protein [Serratia fonticola]CAI1724937.1 Type-1A pilin [Serratia fonticola]